MMVTERSHHAPVTGSPSELMGAGNRSPGPTNCPGLRLRGLTAAGARTVSMVTGFSLRGPQQWGCPAAPVWYDVLAEGSVGELGLVGLRGGWETSGWAGLVWSAGTRGGQAADWVPGPAPRALSWRGGPGRGQQLLLRLQVRADAGSVGG